MARLKKNDEINNLRQKLQETLGDGYVVEANKEVSAVTGYIKEYFDLVVFYHDDAICGIEYMPKLAIPVYVFRFQDLFISRLRKVGLMYGILYGGDDEELYFWTRGEYTLKKFSFENAAIAINGNQKSGKRVNASDLLSDFMDLIPEKLNNKEQEIRELFTDNNLEYDEKSASMWLKSEYEDEFFRILINGKNNDDEFKHVCRYTTLNSLFLIMKEGNHVLCSITCMNDKGETSYADKYVSYGAFTNSSKSVQENNDCFILSCCNKRMLDNLTMWRLYGNDGKGVCLKYEVDQSKIDNNEFFFAPISYGNENRHSELDLIKGLRHWEKNGWHFELKRWYIWKHFFKSHLFKEEKEVRLLFVLNDKNHKKKDEVEWIMDSTHNIVSRIFKFNIAGGKLPLKLTKVIIGPKCPDQASNVDQFKYMNRQLNRIQDNIFNPAIIPSTIKDYR